MSKKKDKNKPIYCPLFGCSHHDCRFKYGCNDERKECAKRVMENMDKY